MAFDSNNSWVHVCDVDSLEAFYTGARIFDTSWNAERLRQFIAAHGLEVELAVGSEGSFHSITSDPNHIQFIYRNGADR